MPSTRAYLTSSQGQDLVSNALDGNALDAWDLGQAVAFSLDDEAVGETDWRALLAICSPRAQEVAQHSLAFAMVAGEHLTAGPRETGWRLDTISKAIEKNDASRERFAETFGSPEWVRWAEERPLRQSSDMQGRAIQGAFGNVSKAYEQPETPAAAAFATAQFAWTLLERGWGALWDLPEEQRAGKSAVFAPWGAALIRTAGLGCYLWVPQSSAGLLESLNLCGELGLFDGIGGDALRDALGQRINGVGGSKSEDESEFNGRWPLGKAASQGPGALRAHAMTQAAPWRPAHLARAIGAGRQAEARTRALLACGELSGAAVSGLLALRSFKGVGRAVLEERVLRAEMASGAAFAQTTGDSDPRESEDQVFGPAKESGSRRKKAEKGRRL